MGEDHWRFPGVLHHRISALVGVLLLSGGTLYVQSELWTMEARLGADLLVRMGRNMQWQHP
jgi:hypothetical protein